LDKDQTFVFIAAKMSRWTSYGEGG